MLIAASKTGVIIIFKKVFVKRNILSLEAILSVYIHACALRETDRDRDRQRETQREAPALTNILTIQSLIYTA